MAINIGDKVRFLNDVGGGIVTKLIDRFTVMVENETGFDVPVKITELVVVEGVSNYTESQKEDSSVSNEKASTAIEPVDLNDIFHPEVVEVEENGDAINVYMAFVPQGRPGNSDIDIYIINDSNYNALYSIINKNELGETYSNSVGMLEANTKELLESLALQSTSQIPEFIFHLTFYKSKNFKVVDPVVKSIKINPVKFYKEKAYLENDFFNEDSIVVPVIADKDEKTLMNISAKEIEKAMKQKEKVEKAFKPVSKKEQEDKLLEVDLHIHELLDDFRGLTNGEILEIQMDHFKEKLATAMKKGPKKIVFIHGVGNGTLKIEIRKELDRKKNKLQYHDASFKEYGFGATMVQLK